MNVYPGPDGLDSAARLREDGRRFREETGSLDVDGFLGRALAAARAAIPGDEPRYTLAEVRANLVTKTEIAARTGVGPTAVYGWITRYEDWPEPVHSGYKLPRHRRDTGGIHAVYWWPDVQAFLGRHGFPRPYRRQSAAGRGQSGQAPQ